MSFALVDPFDLDLEGHKTIGFFLVPCVTFGCSIIRITEKLWPVASSHTHTHTHTHTHKHRRDVEIILNVCPICTPAKSP